MNINDYNWELIGRELVELEKVFVFNPVKEIKPEKAHHFNQWVWDRREHKFVIINATRKTNKYVEELVENLEEQVTRHQFWLIKDGKKVHYQGSYKFNCGYDRGPKRMGILAKIWEVYKEK